MTMKIQIRKKNLFLLCLLEYILFLGLFSRYVEYTNIWNYLLLMFFLISMLIENKCRNALLRNKPVIISLLCSVCFMVLSIIFGTSNEFLQDNFFTLFYPLLICIIIIFIVGAKRDVISDFFLKNFYLINLLWIINLFVLSRQVTGSGFMIKSEWLTLNNFYTDQCCGLFGNSGTHELGMFSIFVMVYNLFYCDFKEKNRTKRRIILFSTLFTQGLMLYYSIYNENLALFLLIPMFAVIYILLKIEWINHSLINKISKYGKYVLLIVVVLFVIFNISTLGSYINEVLNTRIMKIVAFDVTTTQGSNERLAIPYYGLINGWGWKFGKGFGAWRLHKGGYLAFSHFGLSSIGSFINLGGIWFYLSYCFLFAFSLRSICNREKKSKIMLTVCFIVILFLSIYTIIFTSIVSVIWLMLLFAVLGEMRNSIENMYR